MKQLLSTCVMVFEFLLSAECRIWLRLALKPLAVLATLAVFLWLGAWFDTQIANHIAHAETNEQLPPTCPVGLVYDAGLCYTPCPAGFDGVGPLCYKKCPAGYTDDGVTCRKDAHIFGKASYGRGGGSSMICGPNQEAQGGLCYPKCAASHYGVGPVCWQRCPAGYADHGVTCFRGIFDFFGKNTYGRGAGVGVSACPAGMERNGALCYPRCQAGFSGAGPVCFQICPVGYKDDGAVCRKDAHIFGKESVDRGVGKPLNSPPNASDATIRTAKNTAVEISFVHIDLDDRGDKDITVVQEPSHGQLGGNIYDPDLDFEGVDTILWKLNDGKNDSNVAVITILVGNVDPNSAPVALDRTVVVTEETPIRIDVLCTDAENDPLFYQLLEKPQHGAYEWIPPNTVIYTPTVDFVGTDSFTFRSHDGQNPSNVSTITLTVNATNDAPVILTQPISTTRNSNAAVTLAATDAESDAITYTLVSSPTHGSLSGEIPNLLYTPGINFVGDDSFQFRASDAQGAATVATVSITVLPTNTAPVAANLTLSTTQESAVAINLTATDADGDTLTYTLLTNPAHGALSGSGADWIYQPAAGFIGTDSFTYQSNDGQADSPVATVTIQVTPAPDTASVVGVVFADTNGNGQFDGEERGVAGLLVTLTPVDARADASFTTTDAVGVWQIDGVGFGQYTLKVTAGGGVPIEQSIETTLTVAQRGVQPAQPATVKLTGRALYLPVVLR